MSVVYPNRVPLVSARHPSRAVERPTWYGIALPNFHCGSTGVPCNGVPMAYAIPNNPHFTMGVKIRNPVSSLARGTLPMVAAGYPEVSASAWNPITASNIPPRLTLRRTGTTSAS